MTALALDPIYNDFLLTGGAMSLLPSASAAETAQELNARFGFGQGEWFLDLQQGFPWLKSVMVKNPSIRAITNLFRQTILTTPGVKSITSLPLSFNIANRILSVGQIQILHDAGAVIVGGRGQPFIVQAPK